MLRRGHRLGKYRIRGRLAQGGFADVYRAHDTVEGVDVALKIPLASSVGPGMLETFRREARMAAQLDHPNILPLKNADTTDGRFVISYPLGTGSLDERITRRLAVPLALSYGEQLLSALAYAHEQRVIHCDIKPDNLILFGEERLRLADFGLAKVATRTISASASGTIGFMAPEQALGRPSARSDVFSAGLVVYRMLTGVLPEWPYDWPPPGYDRLMRIAPEVGEVLERAIQVDARRRYRDATQMLDAYRKAQRKVLRRRKTSTEATVERKQSVRDWRSVRLRQLRLMLSGRLSLSHRCGACQQPVDERMRVCPWCGVDPLVPAGPPSYPARCPRCERGVKLDWSYCAWCHGPKIGPRSSRRFTDQRYASACGSCGGKLIPFSRYCPWCRVRLRIRWPLAKTARRCGKCEQPVLPGFWAHCPWCGDALSERDGSR
jgi:hypothetical protein